ncbi:MAG: methylamine utilization protein [Nocardioidaceae bacterium]
MIRAAKLAATVLVLWGPALAAAPARAAIVEAIVKDDKGKPIEDAVVYMVPASVPARGAPTATMDQVQQEFVPHVLPVEVGTAVRFPNKDNIRHHVYSFSASKKFELPLYIGTPSTPVVFDKPGVVVLGCNIHDWMVAYVFVLPHTLFAKTGADGRARIENAPAGGHEVRVWHPRLREATEKTGQRLTLAAGAAEASFVVGLKREWRVQRPAGTRYQNPP